MENRWRLRLSGRIHRQPDDRSSRGRASGSGAASQFFRLEQLSDHTEARSRAGHRTPLRHVRSRR